MSRKLILKTIKDQMFPILLLLFLIVTNSFTRIDFFNEIISPDKEHVVVSIDDSTSEQEMNLTVKISSSDCEDSLYKTAYDYFNKADYHNAIKFWKKSLPSTCSQSVTYNNISMAYYKLGKNKLAIKNATKAITLDSLNYKALLNRGNIYAFLKKNKSAIADFKKSYLLYKSYPKSSYNLALLYMNMGNSKKAKKWFWISYKNHDKKEMVLNNIAIILQKEDSASTAKKLYKKAIRIKPEYVVARRNLAKLYQKNGDFASALKQYDAVLKIEGPTAHNYLQIIRAYRDNRDLKIAEQYALEALKRFSGNIDVQYEYAKILGLQSKDREALTIYKKIIQSDGDNPRVYYNIAKNMADIGKIEDAITNYKKAISIDKYHQKSLYNLGTTLLKENRYTESEPYFERLLELNPQNEKASYNLALTYLKLKKNEKALKIFEKIKDGENAYESYYNMGIIYLNKKEYDLAKTSFETCLKLRDKSYKALYNLGILSMKKDAYNDAIEKFQESIAINSKHNQSYYNMAVCYKKLGEYEKAMNNIHKVLEIDANYEKAKRLRCSIYITQHDTINYIIYVKGLDDSFESLEEKMEYASMQNNKILLAKLAVKKLSYDSLNISRIVEASKYLRRANQYDRATKLMERAFAINPNLTIVQKEMFMVLYGMKEYAKSLKYGEYYIINKPNNVSFRKRFVKALEKSENYVKMVHSYEKIYKITNKLEDLEQLAFAYMKVRNYNKALQKYDILITKNSNDSNYYYYRGLTLERGEFTTDMRTEWDNFIKKFKNDSRGYLKMGILLSNAKEYVQSDKLLNKSLQLKERALSLYYLAYNNYNLGKFDVAAKYVSEYLDKTPESEKGIQLKKDITKQRSML